MTYIKNHYFSSILIPTLVCYILFGGYGMQMFGAIIGTILANIALIIGIGAIWYLDHQKNPTNIVTPMELQYNKRDVKISFVLIVLLWLVGQFVFLWVYQTFGDVTYQRNYAEIFNDSTVIWWTIFLTCIIAPIAEELVFRYLLFGRLMYKNGVPSYGRYLFLYLISTIGFGFIHGTVIHQIIVLPLALLLGMLTYKTNRIIFPIMGHMLFNNMSVWLGSLLSIYKNYIDNMLVVGVAVTIYVVLVVTIIGFVLTRKKS